MIIDVDLAYAAGLIDGEGCIQICKHRHSKYLVGYHYELTVRVAMADAEPILWLKQTFGGSLLYSPKKGNNKGMYRWSVSPRLAVKCLNAILPYLKAKRTQAEIALEFQKIKRPAGTFDRYRHKPMALLEAESILAQKLQDLHGGGQRKDLVLHYKLEEH